jgi:hypothetical protein
MMLMEWTETAIPVEMAMTLPEPIWVFAALAEAGWVRAQLATQRPANAAVGLLESSLV